MKILLHYLKPHKWLVALVLLLAAINIGFSLFDPIIFGKLINLANEHQTLPAPAEKFTWHDYLFIRMDYVNKNGKDDHLYGIVWLLGASITVAMISRIAKNFQDYFLNVVIQKFGAKVFTDGLQHAMKLPYQEFEDQRSGETLSVLTKVRADVEKFMINFINILFGVLVGIVFVFFLCSIIHSLEHTHRLPRWHTMPDTDHECAQQKNQINPKNHRFTNNSTRRYYN